MFTNSRSPLTTSSLGLLIAFAGPAACAANPSSPVAPSPAAFGAPVMLSLAPSPSTAPAVSTAPSVASGDLGPSQPRRKPPSPAERAERQIASAIAAATPDWQTFLEAADWPVLLIVFGERSASEEPTFRIADRLSPDAQAYATAIARGIEDAAAGADADSTFVDLKALDDARRGEIDGLAANDEMAAMRLLVEDVGADWIVRCEFVRLASGNHRLICDLVDPRGARRFSTGAHEIEGAGQDRLIAAALFREIAETGVRVASRRPERRDVMLSGELTLQALDSVVRAIAAHEDFEGTRRPSPKQINVKSGVAQRLRFRWAGDGLSLALAFEGILEAQGLGIVSQGFDETGLAFRVVPSAAAAPDWWQLTSAAARGEALASAFRAAYVAAGEPPVAVMFQQYERRPVLAADGETAISWTTEATSRLSDEIAGLERDLAGAMATAGITVIEGAALRGRILDGAMVPMTESAVEDGLRQQLGGGLIVTASIMSEPGAEAGAEGGAAFAAIPSTLAVSLRDLSTNRILATASVPADSAVVASRAFPATRGGYLAGALLDAWRTTDLAAKARPLEVRLAGASSAEQVGRIAEQMHRRIPAIASVAGATLVQGGGRFTVRYHGTYDEFIAAVQRSVVALPITVAADESTTSRLVLGLKSAGGAM